MNSSGQFLLKIKIKWVALILNIHMKNIYIYLKIKLTGTQ